MTTIDDQASMREELFTREALKQRKDEGPAPVGLCHNCEAPVEEDERWCSPECRDDWEYIKERRS